jgi:hypothetical protein
MKFYKIGEYELMNLKIRNKELTLLESNGVDKWEGYGEVEMTTIENYNQEYGTDYEFLDECLQYEVALEMSGYETI